MSSTPDATGTRQRTGRVSPSVNQDVKNPDSLGSIKQKEKVSRKQPHVKPPFWDMSMNKFLTYLALSLAAIGAIYMYRFTVWAADAGGYWNLITGRRPSPAAGMAQDAMDRAASAASLAGGSKATKGAGGKGGKASPDVQGQIYTLAQALGIKPADLSSAIRPLIDPSVPNPAEACTKELELLKLQVQAGGAGAGGAAPGDKKVAGQVDEKAAEGSLLGLAAEALLD